MCTSIVSNRDKTIVGFNLDLSDMEHRVSVHKSGVYIEVYDKTEGWMPLFGANSAGNFVAMPTCWPFDKRSNPKDNDKNIININIELLINKKTFLQTKEVAENGPVCSIPGVTFMSALSDREGNVLHIVPGQGIKYYEKPEYCVLTNFSPFKMFSETHPWMGKDRYLTAVDMLSKSDAGFDVSDCFNILKAVSQLVCPTVVSMVFDVTNLTVHWCENREWGSIKSVSF